MAMKSSSAQYRQRCRRRRETDLAHEHLAEFADDHHLRGSLTAALEASADPHLQRRAGEFVAQ